MRCSPWATMSRRFSPSRAKAPAIAGDLSGNFQLLGQDAQAIIKQLIGTENDAATLFNLFASTQNNLRQTIREAVYTSGFRRYQEEFISGTNLDTGTAVVDFNAGVVMLPLVSEVMVAPDSIDFGVSCVGRAGRRNDRFVAGRPDGDVEPFH